MRGVKLAGVKHTQNLPPYQAVNKNAPFLDEKIHQLADRYESIEEFSPMLSLKQNLSVNLNANAVEFNPDANTFTLPSHKPAESPSVSKQGVPTPTIQDSEKLNLALSQKPIQQDINTLEEKPFYTIEEIFSVFQGFCQFEEFKKLDNRLAIFSRRKYHIYKVSKKKHNKDSKKEIIRTEEFKSAELENWRKLKSLEEEKIRAKAQVTTLKLTSTKDEREKIMRKIKVTLNKLSPTNFSKLSPELLVLAKDSREALAFLIQTIFEKSWAEVKYTAMYAQLCRTLKSEFEGFLYDGESPSKKNQNWFRYCLLSHLQTAFEDNLDSPSKSAEEKALSHKKRYHGSVRFIGELFKVSLVTVNIIQEIVEKLISLKEKDPLIVNEEKLEVACVLISTAGPMNEKKNLKSETDKIFAYLAEIISANTFISSKVRFTIMNLIDERAAGWLKNMQEEPKKVEELRNEFQTELDRKKY